MTSADELQELLLEHRDRLKRIVGLRIDPRLKGRIDASDVIQEAYAEANDRFEQHRQQEATVADFVWLRFLTLQKLAQLHRHHMTVQARSVGKEVKFGGHGTPSATSQVLVADFFGKGRTPSEIVVRDEIRQQVINALDEMDELDREVLTLRHFEHLSNQETAEALGIQSDTAYKRYVRALQKLKKIIENADGHMASWLFKRG